MWALLSMFRSTAGVWKSYANECGCLLTKFCIWSLKFEFHITFTCHKIVLWFPHTPAVREWGGKNDCYYPGLLEFYQSLFQMKFSTRQEGSWIRWLRADVWIKVLQLPCFATRWCSLQVHGSAISYFSMTWGFPRVPKTSDCGIHKGTQTIPRF